MGMVCGNFYLLIVMICKQFLSFVCLHFSVYIYALTNDNESLLHIHPYKRTMFFSASVLFSVEVVVTHKTFEIQNHLLQNPISFIHIFFRVHNEHEE